MLSFCKCVNKFLSFIVHSYLEAVCCSFLKTEIPKDSSPPHVFLLRSKTKISGRKSSSHVLNYTKKTQLMKYTLNGILLVP